MRCRYDHLVTGLQYNLTELQESRVQLDKIVETIDDVGTEENTSATPNSVGPSTTVVEEVE